MKVTSKFILPVVLLLLTYAFGFWLSALGKPYNGLLFNLHKLAALGAVVFAVIRTYSLLKGVNVRFVVIALAVVRFLCVTALFATGTLMSTGGLPHVPLLTVHRVALAALPPVTMAILLVGNKP